MRPAPWVWIPWVTGSWSTTIKPDGTDASLMSHGRSASIVAYGEICCNGLDRSLCTMAHDRAVALGEQ